jgi:hypothetical protein
MRIRFFIFFLTVWCIGHLSAQGTLQFNRVLLLDHSQSPYTVPAGKVWKVESALFSSSLGISVGTSSAQNSAASILINGGSVFFASTWGSSNATSAVTLTSLPIWLPAGTTLAPSTNVSNLSVIEFNEIP